LRETHARTTKAMGEIEKRMFGQNATVGLKKYIEDPE
jgi:hypothetical protein